MRRRTFWAARKQQPPCQGDSRLSEEDYDKVVLVKCYSSLPRPLKSDTGVILGETLLDMDPGKEDDL